MGVAEHLPDCRCGIIPGVSGLRGLLRAANLRKTLPQVVAMSWRWCTARRDENLRRSVNARRPPRNVQLLTVSVTGDQLLRWAA